MRIRRTITSVTAASSSVPLIDSKTSMASARVAGAAGDLDLEPAARIRHRVAPELDRVENRVALAVALQVGGDDRRLAVLRSRSGPRRARSRSAGPGSSWSGPPQPSGSRPASGLAGAWPPSGAGPSEAPPASPPAAAVAPSGTTPGKRLRRVMLRDVLADLGEVRRGQPGLALVDDDRRRELSALEVLGGGERLRRLGVARQERRRLVVLSVRELVRQLAPARRR